MGEIDFNNQLIDWWEVRFVGSGGHVKSFKKKNAAREWEEKE